MAGFLLRCDDLSDNSGENHDGPLHFVDDRDDGGFGGNFSSLERERGFLAAANVNRFAGARADGVDGNDGAAAIEALDQHQSVFPTSASSFTLQTTVPMTLPRYIRSPAPPDPRCRRSPHRPECPCSRTPFGRNCPER